MLDDQTTRLTDAITAAATWLGNARAMRDGFDQRARCLEYGEAAIAAIQAVNDDLRGRG